MVAHKEEGAGLILQHCSEAFSNTYCNVRLDPQTINGGAVEPCCPVRLSEHDEYQKSTKEYHSRGVARFNRARLFNATNKFGTQPPGVILVPVERPVAGDKEDFHRTRLQDEGWRARQASLSRYRDLQYPAGHINHRIEILAESETKL